MYKRRNITPLHPNLGAKPTGTAPVAVAAPPPPPPKVVPKVALPVSAPKTVQSNAPVEKENVSTFEFEIIDRYQMWLTTVSCTVRWLMMVMMTILGIASNKKHKTFKGEAILIINGKLCTLQDVSGKELTKQSIYGEDLHMKEGQTLRIGAYYACH